MYVFRNLFKFSRIKTGLDSNFCTKSNQEGPLDGIRVLDLTRIVAGPYCTMILGDMGAEIIKIERPGNGDEARKFGPPFIGNAMESTYFMASNRNKKSVCVDFKSKDGRDLIYELAEKSDVFVENYIPGKLDELELGYEDLKSIAPHIVYCSITGFGPVGPYRTKPGYDVIAASMGGLLHITGTENGDPVKVGIPVTDISTGLYAHGAIMAALIKRQRTGRGQKVDCDLYSTQLATLVNIGANYLNNGNEANRWGTEHESIVPYKAFKTKNGYVTIGAASDSQFIDFSRRIGRPDLQENNLFRDNKLRVQNRVEFYKIVEEIFVGKSTKEWLEIFEGSNCPCGPVNTIKETFEDPHVKSVKLIKEVTHSAIGSIKLVGPAVRFSEGGNFVRSPPPLLGEHTEAVLKDVLNYSGKRIDYLREKNVIQ